MAVNFLPSEFVTRYTRPPSDTTISRAISVHQSVRDLLGDSDYSTLLQGSYKNDTALCEMNDVDIVVVSRSVVSSYFTNTPVNHVIQWTEIFSRIEQRLQTDIRYQGKWTREDKCIRLNTGIKIDIVPAVRIGEANTDPIAIFSFRTLRERKNWPRGHFNEGVAKSARTSGAFKQTVRLFKKWSRCWFSNRKVAPSYYLECLIHAQPDTLFSGDLARDFVSISSNIDRMQYGYSTLARLIGDGNLLSSDEWGINEFQQFQRTIRSASSHAKAAIVASSEANARASWIAAFNGQQPT